MGNRYNDPFIVELNSFFVSKNIMHIPLELIEKIKKVRKESKTVIWSELLQFEKEAIFQFLYKLAEKNPKFYIHAIPQDVQDILKKVFNVEISYQIANKILVKIRRTLTYINSDIDENFDWDTINDYTDKWLFFNYATAGKALKYLSEKLERGELRDNIVVQLFEKTSNNFAKMLELKLAVLTHLKNNKGETLKIREKLRELIEAMDELDEEI